MQNRTLAKDYITRANKRLKALEALYQEQAWADVVRESQEVVELALKALLRSCHVEAPRTHDVSDVMVLEKSRLPQKIQDDLDRYVEISRQMRRDRELAFYGSEDLTPSEFYKEPDAQRAQQDAIWVVKSLLKSVKF